jgi:DDE domain
VLDILVQDRRNGAAAKRFFKRLLHGLQYKPRRLVTNGLRSYGVAQRAILPDVRHRTMQVLEQSSREFASTHSTTRATDAEVQISQPGTAVPVGARDDLRSFPATAPSHGRSRLSTRSREGPSELGDRRSASIEQRDGLLSPSDCPHTSSHRFTWQCPRFLPLSPVLVIGTHFAGATAGRVVRDGTTYRLEV